MILEEMPPIKTPRKRRARKPKGPVGVKFLRSSTRLNKELQGYKSKGNDEGSSKDVEEDAAAPAHGLQLALVPVYQGSSMDNVDPAPHLPLETVQALGTEYPKMQPMAGSAEVLLACDDD